MQQEIETSKKNILIEFCNFRYFFKSHSFPQDKNWIWALKEHVSYGYGKIVQNKNHKKNHYPETMRKFNINFFIYVHTRMKRDFLTNRILINL